MHHLRELRHVALIYNVASSLHYNTNSCIFFIFLIELNVFNAY